MRLVLLLASLLACCSYAQAEPQVRVEARLQPAAPYQVGATLRLDQRLVHPGTTTGAAGAAERANLAPHRASRQADTDHRR